MEPEPALCAPGLALIWVKGAVLSVAQQRNE